MLNFYVVQKRFEEQIYDILRYEIYYHEDNNIIIYNFVDRFMKYISLRWDSYVVNWSIQQYPSEHLINILIQFNDDPSFGFEFCIDLNLLFLT